MTGLSKLAVEEILIGRDWTLDLDGATIASVPDAVVSDPTLTCESIEPVGNTTRYWLRGGGHGLREVIISIVTSEGETLAERFDVIVT